MKYRKLRIAWSVAWGVVCLLLVALWVRSYWWMDLVHFQSGISTRWAAGVENGAFGLAWGESLGNLGTMPSGWTRWSERSHTDRPGPLIAYIFRAFGRPLPDVLEVPAWFFVAVSGALATTPWLRWRLSLRTLLIGITVAAIGLGWFVYTLKK